MSRGKIFKRKQSENLNNKNIIDNKLIKENDIKNNISLLPKEMQKKIYIICFRKFWRSYVPLTAKIPSWYYHKVEVEKIIYDSKINNIHFLHLPFNTLECNKKYILGCQCNFCKQIYNLVDMNNEYQKLLDDPYYFKKIIPSSGQGINDFYHIYGGETLVKNFDPYCGTIYEDEISYCLRTGEKINFQ